LIPLVLFSTQGLKYQYSRAFGRKTVTGHRHICRFTIPHKYHNLDNVVWHNLDKCCG